MDAHAAHTAARLTLDKVMILLLAYISEIWRENSQEKCERAKGSNVLSPRTRVSAGWTSLNGSGTGESPVLPSIRNQPDDSKFSQRCRNSNTQARKQD